MLSVIVLAPQCCAPDAPLGMTQAPLAGQPMDGLPVSSPQLACCVFIVRYNCNKLQLPGTAGPGLLL